MTGFFSQLKTTRFKSKNKRSPATVPAEKKSYTDCSGKNLISGSLFIMAMLLLIGLLAYSLDQTRQNTAKLEIIARMQTHIQRLPIALQLAFSGREIAFTQIYDSHKKINQYIAILAEGGLFHQHNISPIDQESLRIHLDDLIDKWRSEERKIQVIIDKQETLLKLGQAVSVINSTTNELHQRIEQLVDRLTLIGNQPKTLGAIIAMRTLTQNVTRSVNVILSSKLPVSEINKQLAHDRKQFSIILQAFSEGHDILNLSAMNDPEALEVLPQIKPLFITIDNNIHTIQTELSAVMAANAAASEIIRYSETFLSSILALDKALQTNYIESSDLLAKILVGLLIGVILTLCAFIYSLRQNKSSSPQIYVNNMDDTQKAMLQLLDDMKKMAEGDLTTRTVVTEDITGAIADAVNFTIEELHSLVEQVNKAGTLVVNASRQAQHVSNRLLSAAQQQSLKIEETTVAVLGMAESINTVSDTASKSTEVAKQSLVTAEKGNKAVRESIAGMDEIRTNIQETSKRIKRLGESSQEIGEIIALVSDITEQTNILALNAALQATAAGEAGRGFNMIAQEVQRLAERSAESSKHISRLIKMMQNDTYDTIAAMERSTLEVIKGTQKSNIAGKALEEIEAVSRHLSEHVANIYATTHAQTQAANTVIENMEEILQITQQTTVGTQETTASIEQISGFASELKASVSNFKI
ncbi:MAG: methyl-accepting chemotaxis protein [Nitrosomonas sp.]|nr:methyl-accepting chemotaxis protein [Nitrosomonas sp.]